MEWSNLQSLGALKRTGSLKRAAAELRVNYTTVARHIRQLEADLGCSLVELVGGRLQLTPAGRRASEVSERIRADALALELELDGRDAELSGMIRVGLLDLFVEEHSRAIADFSATYPEVQVVLRSSGSHLHSLVNREVDVVIRVAREPRETLIGRRLRTLRYAVFAADSIPETEFSELPWVGWDPSVGASQSEAWLEEHAPPSNVRARVDSVTAMFRLVEAGVGAAILPVAYAARRPLLSQRGDTLDGFETSVWMLTHRDLAQLERIRRFMAHVADAVSEPRDRA
ncbi:MAG: LysR family transcriptional regulator [Myxococcota bacterium]